jgi:uncharacterized protein (TIGR02118 family)
VIKLFVFLKRRPNLSQAEFRRLWRDDHAPVVTAAAGFKRFVRRYVQSVAIEGAEIPELTLSDFDGCAELWFDTLAELAASTREPSEEVAASAHRFVDPARTIRLAAEEAVQFDRGFGAVKFIGLSRRAPRFATRDDWIRYWVEVHGPLAHGIPEFTRYYGRYVHNYVVPERDDEPEYDGIVEEWLESVDAFARCLAEPKYLEIVRPDEVEFVDFARSHMLLTEEDVVFKG